MKLPEKGSEKHLYDLLSNANYAQIMNKVLAGTGVEVAPEDNHERECQVEDFCRKFCQDWFDANT